MSQSSRMGNFTVACGFRFKNSINPNMSRLWINLFQIKPLDTEAYNMYGQMSQLPTQAHKYSEAFRSRVFDFSISICFKDNSKKFMEFGRI